MGDNVELNSGSGGEIVATDQIGTSSGPHYQVVKPAYGALGTANLVSTSLPLPVQLTSNIGLSSGTVTLSSATSLSSGLVTLSSAHTVVAASSGLLQVIPVTSSGINLYTTGGILVVSASSGLLQLTSAISLSSGTVTLSSAPTVVAASSGLLQVIPVTSSGINLYTTSGIHVVSASSGLVQLTSAIALSSGVVTLSSDPGLSSGLVTLSSNHTFISASSGAVQALGFPHVTSSGLLTFSKMSTGGAVAANVTTAPASLYGYAVFNSTATPQAVKLYDSTGPTVGASTANLRWTIFAPGSTGGGGANLAFPYGIYSSNGWSVVITANLNDTDTGAPGTNNVNANVAYLV